MRTKALSSTAAALLTCALGLVLLTGEAESQTPDFINYQGRLTDAGGTPLDGSYSIAFSIWDDSTSGTQLWVETLPVEVTDGLFGVNLGRINSLTVDICGGVDPWFIPYLQLEVAGEVIDPRTPLGRVTSSFISQRVRGDIETAPGEVTVGDNVKITSGTSSSEIRLSNGVGNEAIGVSIDNMGGQSLTMVGAAGDTAAQYGPGEIVMVQLQPEPPSPSECTRMGPGSLVMGVDPTFDKQMAEVCNNGVILTDSATGDTTAQYGPGEIVMVQLQPEPPSPQEFTRMGPGALVLGIDPLFDRRMAEVCINGVILTDTSTGDTVSLHDRDRLIFTTVDGFDTTTGSYGRDGSSLDVTTTVERSETNYYLGGIKHVRQTTSNETDTLTLDRGGLDFKSSVGTGLPQQGKYSIDGVILADSEGDTTLSVSGSEIELMDWDMGVQSSIARLRSEALLLTKFSGTEETSALYDYGLAMLSEDDGSGGGTVSKRTSESLTFSVVSTFGEDTTVLVSNSGLKVDTAAGPTKAVSTGEYHRDNSIVAWARVNGSATGWDDYGVVSISRVSSGHYSITIDASMSSSDQLIPLANAELDSQPTDAYSARIVSVHQTTSVNTFEVYINDGNYAPVDNDFVFIVTGR